MVDVAPLVITLDSDKVTADIRAYIDRKLAELEAEGRLLPASTEVREEWGTRLTWPGGKVEDRWCYRDRDDAAAQVGWFADQIPHAVPGGSLYGATVTLLRRLHLTLAAETVEEQR